MFNSVKPYKPDETRNSCERQSSDAQKLLELKQASILIAGLF
jgi:hypothetical protein